jgi:hypothetical protein
MLNNGTGGYVAPTAQSDIMPFVPVGTDDDRSLACSCAPCDGASCGLPVPPGGSCSPGDTACEGGNPGGSTTSPTDPVEALQDLLTFCATLPAPLEPAIFTSVNSDQTMQITFDILDGNGVLERDPTSSAPLQTTQSIVRVGGTVTAAGCAEPVIDIDGATPAVDANGRFAAYTLARGLTRVNVQVSCDDGRPSSQASLDIVGPDEWEPRAVLVEVPEDVRLDEPFVPICLGVYGDGLVLPLVSESTQVVWADNPFVYDDNAPDVAVPRRLENNWLYCSHGALATETELEVGVGRTTEATLSLSGPTGSGVVQAGGMLTATCAGFDRLGRPTTDDVRVMVDGQLAQVNELGTFNVLTAGVHQITCGGVISDPIDVEVIPAPAAYLQLEAAGKSRAMQVAEMLELSVEMVDSFGNVTGGAADDIIAYVESSTGLRIATAVEVELSTFDDNRRVRIIPRVPGGRIFVGPTDLDTVVPEDDLDDPWWDVPVEIFTFHEMPNGCAWTGGFRDDEPSVDGVGNYIVDRVSATGPADIQDVSPGGQLVNSSSWNSNGETAIRPFPLANPSNPSSLAWNYLVDAQNALDTGTGWIVSNVRYDTIVDSAEGSWVYFEQELNCAEQHFDSLIASNGFVEGFESVGFSLETLGQSQLGSQPVSDSELPGGGGTAEFNASLLFTDYFRSEHLAGIFPRWYGSYSSGVAPRVESFLYDSSQVCGEALTVLREPTECIFEVEGGTPRRRSRKNEQRTGRAHASAVVARSIDGYPEDDKIVRPRPNSTCTDDGEVRQVGALRLMNFERDWRTRGSNSMQSFEIERMDFSTWTGNRINFRTDARFPLTAAGYEYDPPECEDNPPLRQSSLRPLLNTAQVQVRSSNLSRTLVDTVFVRNWLGELGIGWIAELYEEKFDDWTLAHTQLLRSTQPSDYSEFLMSIRDRLDGESSGPVLDRNTMRSSEPNSRHSNFYSARRARVIWDFPGVNVNDLGSFVESAEFAEGELVELPVSEIGGKRFPDMLSSFGSGLLTGLVRLAVRRETLGSFLVDGASSMADDIPLYEINLPEALNVRLLGMSGQPSLEIREDANTSSGTIRAFFPDIRMRITNTQTRETSDFVLHIEDSYRIETSEGGDASTIWNAVPTNADEFLVYGHAVNPKDLLDQMNLVGLAVNQARTLDYSVISDLSPALRGTLSRPYLFWSVEQRSIGEFLWVPVHVIDTRELELAMGQLLRPVLAGLVSRAIRTLSPRSAVLPGSLAGTTYTSGATLGWVPSLAVGVGGVNISDGRMSLGASLVALGQSCTEDSQCACTPGQEFWCESEEMVCGDNAQCINE